MFYNESLSRVLGFLVGVQGCQGYIIDVFPAFDMNCPSKGKKVKTKNP